MLESIAEVRCLDGVFILRQKLFDDLIDDLRFKAGRGMSDFSRVAAFQRRDMVMRLTTRGTRTGREGCAGAGR